jgi:tetratricopeptide (TPR) repeat protein
LLSFYSYSLEQTAADKVEIDSVIYKITTGILIHDLRTDWLDNMYLLLGKAYYFRNQLDTAFQTFQYINYAFSPKEKDGYDKVIGSNSNEGGNAFSIATKENRKGIKKVLEQPPSRNESFVWQVRTFIQLDQLAEAEGLIEMLKNDPNFPPRLQTDLMEMKAFWFYKQNMFDSSAKYLALALDNAETTNETARWEYLIAQMYERSGQSTNAEQFYTRAMRHAYDPVMEVFARLNALRQTKDGKENTIKQNIDELVKMGRRDKYFNYRDVIYYSAAQMELGRHNEPGAIQFLLKSARYSKDNPDQRNISFLQLADLAFKNRDYRSAKNFYDSVNATPALIKDMDAFNERKQTVSALLIPLSRIEREDSLQKIAAMPEAEREAYLKKLVKQLRKAEGLKDETITGGSVVSTSANEDLFGKADKGVWYFDNASLKAKGFTEFKSKWGTRPNVDNWRRIAAVIQFAQAKPVDNKVGNVPPFSSGSTEISYDALAGNLPLTPEKIKVSNDSIESAYMLVGKVYVEQLEDYPFAIAAYEKLLSRFPSSTHKEDAWFNLYYSYWKLHDQAKANYYKSLLMQDYPAGKYAKALNPGSTTLSPDSMLNIEATAAYTKIYNLFVEGEFEKAVSAKKEADAMYGNKFWTPQLSYIEAVYYIKQRNDSTAKVLLSDLVYRFRNSPMYSKAQTLLEVLTRRKEIETYLTNLQVQREGEDTSNNKVTTEQKPVVQAQQPISKNENAVVQNKVPPPVVPQPIRKDSVQNTTPAAKTYYTFSAQAPQMVMVALDKVDPVYVTETRNAFNRYNRENYYNKTFEINNMALDDNLRLVVIKPFENAETALDYINKAKKVSASDIIPWLPADKYSFYLISAANLDVLLSTKDLKQYKQEMTNAYPGKF